MRISDWSSDVCSSDLAAQRMMVRNSMPLDYQAFNRFHHGGKVLAQDVEVLEHSLAVGRQKGREMPALAALLDAYRVYRLRDGAIIRDRKSTRLNSSH